MILGLIALLGLFFSRADAQCQVLGLYQSPADFTLSLDPTSVYKCTQYHIGPRSYNTNIQVDLSSVSINCAASDNIIFYEQSGNQVYNVCDMKRLYALTTFKITYYGPYFIVSLSIGSTTAISGFFHFTLPSATSAPTLAPTPAPTTTAISQSTCGVPYYAPNDSEMRIVGGVTANPNSWPWQILITDGLYMCGGSLIASQWIITAAHCDFSSENPGGVTKAYLGMHTLYNPTATRTVVKKIPFGYNSNTMKNDILLMKLDSPVTFTDKIQPICLPTSLLATTSRVAMITGWGLTRTGGAKSISLRQVAIPINSNSECIYNKGYNLDSTQLCAGYPSANASAVKDSCQGDSGGPLFTKEGNHYVLGGIVSYGSPCDGYGVYTNVYPYMSSIIDAMNKN